jgi:hypothetical protein
MKVLFILKKRNNPFVPETNLHANSPGLSTGLYNSASFVNDMLLEESIDSAMVVVNDNNDIDREVTRHRPTHVIIEALWVVPSKFAVLKKLHPTVEWIIRLHSELPFLAGEGMAMNWLGDYASFEKVSIAINAPRLLKEMRFYLGLKYKWDTEECEKRVFYLPNFYPQTYLHREIDKTKDTIDIGCFGAIRPLKNHMNQALAAVLFAEKIGKKLNFHINSGRQEQKGEPVFNNLRAFFLQLIDTGHQLVDNVWTPRNEFLELCGKMDIGMQVSFSETFNIVGADLVSQGVPVVMTTEIPWSVSRWCASPTETEEIYQSLLSIYEFPNLAISDSQRSLYEYTNKTREIWKEKFDK